MDLSADGYTGSFRSDGNVVQLNRADGCTTPEMYYKSLHWTLQLGEL